MRKSVFAIVAIIVIIGSLLSLYRRSCQSHPKVQDGLFVGLGEVVAEETDRLLQGRGQVVLWTFNTGPTKNPAIEKMIDSFRHKLHGCSQIRVMGREMIEVTLDSPTMEEGFRANQFWQLLEKNKTADAIVSFVGVPPLTAAEIRQLSESRPKILVGYNPQMLPMRMLIENGPVRVAIAPRRVSPDIKIAPKTPREWFDRYFMVITPQNVGSLTE